MKIGRKVGQVSEDRKEKSKQELLKMTSPSLSICSLFLFQLAETLNGTSCKTGNPFMSEF
jgi:hypothetical protein